MSDTEMTHLGECPFCGHALANKYSGIEDRLSTTPMTFSLSECTGCAMGMLNPVPTGDFARFYPESYLSGDKVEGIGGAPSLRSALERWYRYNQYAFDFRLLKRASGIDIGGARSYVDVGCGSGERVAFAFERGCTGAVGVDRYDFVKVAAKATGSIVQSEILDFEPVERFQVASLFHVLEHVENPRDVLRHISTRILESGGRLVVQVPNYASLERKVFGRRWFGLDAPRHIWDFNERVLVKLFRECGYSIEASYRRNAPLHPVTIVPSLFRSLDPQRIWSDPKHGDSFKALLLFLWASATVLSIPPSVAQSICNRSSMLTVVAING